MDDAIIFLILLFGSFIIAIFLIPFINKFLNRFS